MYYLVISNIMNTMNTMNTIIKKLVRKNVEFNACEYVDAILLAHKASFWIFLKMLLIMKLYVIYLKNGCKTML